MNWSGIHFSCMLVDPQTVDASWRAILLRVVTSFPQSAFLEEYIQEETRHRAGKNVLRQLAEEAKRFFDQLDTPTTVRRQP